MKHLLLLLALGLVAVSCDSIDQPSPASDSVALTGGAEAGVLGKVSGPLCHPGKEKKGEVKYKLIKTTDKKFEEHLSHEDPEVGRNIPDMAGYVFDEKCKPELVACPCWEPTELKVIPWGTFMDVGFSGTRSSTLESVVTTTELGKTLSTSIVPILTAVVVNDGFSSMCSLTTDSCGGTTTSSACTGSVPVYDLSIEEVSACRIKQYQTAQVLKLECTGDFCFVKADSLPDGGGARPLLDGGAQR